ncbi:molybdate ABC transporter substrate-binding protein [Mycobacterium cookii]|nr:molybdate ABC transporter substrate-binding protein [Mycobacterium cookii]MCV7331145.1 molybdate ABC transporter substrate-binding protein [Mycobacterium cookii]
MSLTMVTSVGGCAHKAPSPQTPSHSPTASVMVFAAVPLKAAFTLLAGKFQTDNPGAAVDFNFATSSQLANKLTQGATADVFASADSAQMDTVVKAGLTGSDPVNFATNTLVIVTAPGDPKQIHSFADLAKPGLRVAVCQSPVPCGVATQLIEDHSGVQLNPASEESTVSAVLTKVTGGEADAGLVYLSDARKAGEAVDTVNFPESTSAVTVYPIAILKHASQPALAQKFVDLVTGPTGEKVLSQAGFANP